MSSEERINLRSTEYLDSKRDFELRIRGIVGSYTKVIDKKLHTLIPT